MKHKMLFAMAVSLDFLCLMMNISESLEEDIENIGSLIMQLEDKDASVRRDAALALGKIAVGETAKSAVPALIKTLSNKEWTVRVGAANALGDMGQAAKDAVPALIKALGDENYQVRYWTADALGKIGEFAKDAVPELIKALSDKELIVRLGVTDALGRIGEVAKGKDAVKDAVPELIKALSDKDNRIRANVALALGKIGNPAKDVVSALIKALNDEDPGVRESASMALGKIAIPGFIAPGQEVRIDLSRSYMLVYVPEDYDPKRYWPVIFCYHGYYSTAKTWPFRQVTKGKGFIIVGMEYATKDYHLRLGLNKDKVGPEVIQFNEALAIVSSMLKVDPKTVFMGGSSQGGYSTSILGEQLLDKLAGLVILAAGRSAGDRYPPPAKSIKGKPIFIGVGEIDNPHNERSKNAVRLYKLWGADVTFEEWPGIGHTGEFIRLTRLHDWLLSMALASQKDIKSK